MLSAPDSQQLYRARIERVISFIDDNLVAKLSLEGYGEDISKSYKILYGDWLPHSGYQPADQPGYEIYQMIPEQHPDGKFVIDFCIPVIPL